MRTETTALVAKPKTPHSNVRTKPADEPVTTVEYHNLQAAFSVLNDKLFDGNLKNVVITLPRQAHSGGHFAPDRYAYRVDTDTRREHEIALNPDGFIGRTDEFIVSILLHEMVHEWQHHFGKQRRAKYSYHDKEWAAKMEALGLMPSNTGMVGGKRTGQQMSHFIIPNGPYAQAFAELAATGWKLNLESTIHAGRTKSPPSKVKFTCPDCGSNMWGKLDSKDICGECNQWRQAAVAPSYDKKILSDPVPHSNHSDNEPA